MRRQHIRVATYNVHKCRGLDRRTRTERIAAVIRELNCDVVALQEVLAVEHGNPQYDQVRRLADRLPEYRSCFGENRRLLGAGDGNLTLSRLPVIDCINYDITWGNRERRGCLRTDVQLFGEIILHVFNVHLGTGFIERPHQVQRLLSDSVPNQAKFARPRIIAGDFNEWTRGLATSLMGREFLAAEPRAFMRYNRTYPGVLPFLHLDHFYFDHSLTLTGLRLHRSRKALVASDHLPLEAEFEIKG